MFICLIISTINNIIAGDKMGTKSNTVEYTTNFIVFTDDGEFKWALCDFISGDSYGDNAESIDNKIKALRDKDGAISKEQLELLIKEYWSKIPDDIKEAHENHKTIITTSDDESCIDVLSDFSGGHDNALYLLNQRGFGVDATNQEYVP